MAPQLSSIRFYREAMHLQWFMPMHYVSAHMNMTSFTRFAQNCNIGNLLALYGSVMHVATL